MMGKILAGWTLFARKIRGRLAKLCGPPRFGELRLVLEPLIGRMAAWPFTARGSAARSSSCLHLQDLSFGNFQHSNHRDCLLHLSSFKQMQSAAIDAERTSQHGLAIVQLMAPGLPATAPIATATGSRLINSSWKALLHISQGKIAILSSIPFPPTTQYDETIIAFWHLL